MLCTQAVPLRAGQIDRDIEFSINNNLFNVPGEMCFSLDCYLIFQQKYGDLRSSSSLKIKEENLPRTQSMGFSFFKQGSLGF